MNGKGSSPRPFAVDYDLYEKNRLNVFHNLRDAYRIAVSSPDFHEKYPNLTGNWGEDREMWLALSLVG